MDRHKSKHWKHKFIEIKYRRPSLFEVSGFDQSQTQKAIRNREKEGNRGFDIRGLRFARNVTPENSEGNL